MRRSETPPRRLLYLTPFAPNSDAPSGGARVIAQVLRRISASAEVALIYLRAAGEPPLDPQLREQCVLAEEIARPLVGPARLERLARQARLALGWARGWPMLATDWTVPGVARRVRALAQTWRPDLVQAEYSLMVPYLPDRTVCPAPRVLTIHEPAAQAAEERVADEHGAQKAVRTLDADAWRRFEAAMIQQVDTVITFTEPDQAAVVPLAGNVPVARIPFGVTVPARPMNQDTAELQLLFVGSFTHYPNIDAAERLTQAIYPRVRAARPDVRLTIVGADPPQSLWQAGPGVQVAGYVPDITLLLSAAALVVVPLRRGGGMRVKVLEALAAGKALVASPLAIAGLDLADGKQVALAESDDDFAAVILRLLARPEERASLSASAHAWALQNCSWERAAAAYQAVQEGLIETQRSHHEHRICAAPAVHCGDQQ